MNDISAKSFWSQKANNRALFLVDVNQWMFFSDSVAIYNDAVTPQN